MRTATHVDRNGALDCQPVESHMGKRCSQSPEFLHRTPASALMHCKKCKCCSYECGIKTKLGGALGDTSSSDLASRVSTTAAGSRERVSVLVTPLRVASQSAGGAAAVALGRAVTAAGGMTVSMKSGCLHSALRLSWKSERLRERLKISL